MSEKNTLPRSAMNILPLKERMKILRRHMPEMDARCAAATLRK